MACLLFRLNGVPEDEAEQIRNRLEEAKLDYYETNAGRWGLSFAAIWLKDDKQLSVAQNVLRSFQSERQNRARQLLEQQRQSGEYLSRWTLFKSSPIKYTLAVIFSITIFYFSITPFLLLDF